MSSPVERLATALLVQHPGSQVLARNEAATFVNVAGDGQLIILFEATKHPLRLAQELSRAEDALTRGVVVQVVLINESSFDLNQLLTAQVPEALLTKINLHFWNWVPGRAPIPRKTLVVKGPLMKAAELANSSEPLSLEQAMAASESEQQVRDAFIDEVTRRKPVVTWAIGAVCVAFFGLQWLWGAGEPMAPATAMGGLVPTKVLAGDWWRLFSVMVLHGHIPHLVLNMLALFSFGTFFERLIGNGRYLALYVLSGLGGSLLSLTRFDQTIGVGASGGIWGLMVGGAVLVTWPRGILPKSLAFSMRQRAWTPVVINVLYSLQPGIDMRAHLGGGLVGGLLAVLLTLGAPKLKPVKRSWPTDVLAAVVALLLVGSVGIALTTGKPWTLNGPWTLERRTLEGEKVSVLVPDRFPLTHEAGSNLWSYGDINVEGAQLLVVVTPELAPDEDPDVSAQEMLDAQQKQEGFTFKVEPKRVKLPSGREAIFSEVEPLDVKDARFLRQWWLLVGRRWVMVAGNVRDEIPAEQRLQLEGIADSVQPAP